MKLFVLVLATAAVASASLFGGKKVDIRDDGTIVIQGDSGKQVFVKKPYGPYSQRNIEIDVTGPNTLAKRIQIDNNNQVSIESGVEYSIPTGDDEYVEDRNKRAYSFPAITEEGKDLEQSRNQEQYLPRLNGMENQYNYQYFYSLLFKIFDRQFIMNFLNRQQMYNQFYYEQKSMNEIWDIVFAQEGIFDHQYLIEIINTPELRTWFVQHGYFNKAVLDEILYAYKTEGVYKQYLLTRLVNTQVLKYFFMKHGVSVYDILGQNTYKQYYGSNTFYNKGIYGYSMLEKVLSQPNLRNAMVQYGIFNKNILDQILHNYSVNGVYDRLLLRQLVNKQALYNVLVQCGVVDKTVLRQWVDNEYLGLRFLFKTNFFQQTPKMNYNRSYRVYGNVPEFDMNGGNFFKNFFYGKQYEYNQGPYNYGKQYYQYPMTQQYYY